MAGKAAQRRGRPLWIAFVGISYTRGILHSLADLLCDGRCGFFRGGARNVPRLGSTLKCWGWFDYLHDGIRMSYQDWRLPNHIGKDAPFRQRLAQLIGEGPDLLFMQAIPGAGQDWLFGFCRQHTQLLKSWRGTMVYSVIQRSTAVAGLDMEQGQATFQNTRQGFLKQLDMLEKEIPGLREKVLLWNINPMLWATIYDTERPLGSCRSTQHWHHYNRPGARRAVLGMSTEMVAHILLAQLVETSSNSRDADLGANAALSGYSATERLLCVNCPERACCPWVALTQPNYTLSVPRGQLKLSGTASNYGCLKDP